ncbi:MAG TPA: polyprenol monophosphomannose synthase [Nanoarchaeota archaeon]|nr:MAG: dolichol-phosphate mannosyltransferase [archaeon GW2011_AR6]MBS3082777.1 polyprenol monophosphomannose synthase [Candidatus Pacearchaeota archaeon]HIH17832.1 polyprenol monophosphomannose synthase [Nanoarchaeota archaeon]HIH34088.1 polyprenol monophosphomannose synthase [Nanoarchaeota archaeon]HIH51795.1 polyprenol monophosphomannose synthase [Nanoarchaeota archaeon]
MKVCIVLPTYNEKECIEPLLKSILTISGRLSGFDTHILVVDDNSPDGTADVVRWYIKKYKNVHLLAGEKNGLGVAYVRGFNYAINKLKADVLFQMDADLSHNPHLIPKFLQEIKNGYDVVVGSRYIKGGGMPDWSLSRKIISTCANTFARLSTRITNVHDFTSGYRAIRTNYLKKINFNIQNLRGYAFLVELLYQLHLNGARIKEIPLVFKDRKHGRTKLGVKDALEFFSYSLGLFFRKNKF